MGWWWKADQTSVSNGSGGTAHPSPSNTSPSSSVDTTNRPALSSPNGNERADADLQHILPVAFTVSSDSENANPDAAEQSLYPSTLSCRELFDSAFYCQSFGGQFNNVYRYGTFRSCSEHWLAWRFCMRLKTLSPKERKAKIRQFYMEKEARRKMGKSSEDIWKARAEPLEKAFWKDPDSW